MSLLFDQKELEARADGLVASLRAAGHDVADEMEEDIKQLIAVIFEDLTAAEQPLIEQAKALNVNLSAGIAQLKRAIDIVDEIRVKGVQVVIPQ